MLKADSIPDTEVLASLPVFPLPNVVLLPGMLLPLNVFEPRYLELVDFVRDHGQHIGVPLLRPGDERTVAGLPAFEPVFGIGKLVFHVRLPDGRRIIRLEGLGRVQVVHERPMTHLFREVTVAALDEPHPEDSEALAVLRAQIERIAQYCDEDGEALTSVLALPDARVLLYALTAFLPSLELLPRGQPDRLADRRALVDLQQQSLAAATPDERVRFLGERTTKILQRLARAAPSPNLLN